MTYLTYSEYKNKGGTLDAATFDKHIDFADSIIKNRTYGRIEKMKIIPEEAKSLCREIVDFAERIKGDSSKVTSKSQSAGAVSESVSYANLTSHDIESELGMLVKTYLGGIKDDEGTPLLYCGV